MKNSQKGFVIPALSMLIAVLLIGGGVYAYTKKAKQDVVMNRSMEATSTETTINEASSTSPTTSSQLLDIKTVKPGDTFGKLTVSTSSVVLYPDGSPKSVHISFIGEMILAGTVGMNDMTGALILSTTKEGGDSIPKFKGEEDLPGVVCLTGDTDKIGISSLQLSKKVTVKVKNYSIYVEGKGGCTTRVELVSVISESSPTADWNTYQNKERKFEIKYPQQFSAREIYTKDVIACFDNQLTPFAVCIDEEDDLNRVVNNAGLFGEFQLDAIEKRLNTKIKAEAHEGIYRIHVNNIIVRSNDKGLLREMISTLQISGHYEGISK